MTAKNQISALVTVGCDDAIREIRQQNGNPLTDDRLKQYLQKAVEEGYVSRAIALTALRQKPFTPIQLGRMINRCLQLGWTVDAVHAARQGAIAEKTRRRLTAALLADGLATTVEEAAAILKSH